MRTLIDYWRIDWDVIGWWFISVAVNLLLSVASLASPFTGKSNIYLSSCLSSIGAIDVCLRRFLNSPG